MQDKLRSILHQAMKNKDYLRTETIRMMMAELTNKEKERGEPAMNRMFLGFFTACFAKEKMRLTNTRKQKGRT